MNGTNAWLAYSLRNLLNIFPHNQLVAWLCTCTRYLILEVRESEPWYWFVNIVRELVSTYVPGAHVETTYYSTQKISPDILTAICTGWEKFRLLEQLTLTTNIEELWQRAPHHHPLYLVHALATMCSHHEELQTERGNQFLRQGLRKKLEQGFIRFRLPGPQLIERPEFLSRQLVADALYNKRSFFVMFCHSNSCPERAFVPHAHLIPRTWPGWLEPELMYATLRNLDEAQEFFYHQFAGGRLSAAMLDELSRTLECSELPVHASKKITVSC